MEWICANLSTIVVLLALVVLVGVALRSLHSGAASCESCNGSCGDCSSDCSNPKLKLSLAQEEKLRLLKAKAGL